MSPEGKVLKYLFYEKMFGNTVSISVSQKHNFPGREVKMLK